MRSYVINFLMYIFFIGTCARCERNLQLDKYLSDRLDFVNDQLNGLNVFPRETKSRIEFHEQKTVALSEKYEGAHTFALFNSSYLLLDYELFHILPGDHKFVMSSRSKFAKLHDKITFIKSVDYTNIGLVFIAFDDGLANVYMHTNGTDQQMFLQSIQNPSKLTDASFFTNNNDLYLVVTSMHGNSLAPIILYKWEGSHFDEVDRILTEGAIAVTTFQNFDSEIMVVLRNNGIGKSNSFVYEMKNEKLRKLQILDTTAPKLVTTYTQQEKRYVVIFDEGAYNVLYWWDESELVPFHNIDKTNGVQKLLLTHTNGNPLIVAAQKDKMTVYSSKLTSLQAVSTINFTHSFSKVLDVQLVRYHKEDVLFILGATSTSHIHFAILPFKVHEIEIVSQTRNIDPLTSCLEELEDLLRRSEDVIENIFAEIQVNEPVEFNGNITKVQTNEPVEFNGNITQVQTNEALEINGNISKVQTDGKLQTNAYIAVDGNITKVEPDKPVEFNGRINVGAPVVAQSADAEETIPTAEFNENMQIIELDASTLDKTITMLDAQVEQLLQTNDRIINSKLIIQGSLNAQLLETESLHVTKLNGLNWTPEKWLSYGNNQSLAGGFVINELFVDELVVSPQVAIFNNLLLLDGNQKLTKPANLGSLSASKIYTEEINGIPISSIYLRSEPVKITGNKTFINVRAENAHMKTLNGKNASDTLRLFADKNAVKYEFLPNLKIKHLQAKLVNNVDWNEFTKTAFRVGTSQQINGNLTVVRVKTDHLNAKLISGIDASKLLTTSTDQTIDSSIRFGNVNAKNVVCDDVNGLNFGSDVVTFDANANTSIPGPVTIKNIQIRGHLHINGSAFNKQNHIVGTNETDLLQIYNNKVRIIGNLHLENLVLLHSARLFIAGNEFNQANFNEYWLKTTNQDIPVHFETHQGISTPHLTAKLLNAVPIDRYMVNSLDDKMATSYVFENATIDGNIIVHEDHFRDTAFVVPDLRGLEENSVKLNGTFVIRGFKTFTDKLSVDNLKTDVINSVPVTNIVTKHSQEILGNKTFEKLRVLGDVNTNLLSTKRINGLELDKLYENAIFIDEPTELESLDFLSASAKNLTSAVINKKNFNEYLLQLDQINLMAALKRVTIHGNASVRNFNGVTSINDINLKDMAGRQNQPIKSNITFDSLVHVKYLNVVSVNNINFQELLPRLFFRYWPQSVPARHTFNVVTAPNVVLSRINQINVANLIDVESLEPQTLQVQNGLQMVRPKILKSLFATTYACDMFNAINSIREVPTRFWNNLTILNNVELLDEEASLGRILKHAVNSKRSNIITAPVTLNHAFAETVVTKRNINGINLEEIVNDAVLTSADEQIITGFKEFTSLITGEMVVLGDVQIPYINSYEMMQINKSIINKSDVNTFVIKGRKTFFGGLQTTNLNANLVSGVKPENLVSLSNLQPIPNTTFDTLQVTNNLDISFVNGQDFKQFLSDRLLLNSDADQVVNAVYYFDEIELKGNSSIPKINNVSMYDVVFDEGVQIIEGPKKFLKDLVVEGDVIIDEVNGYRLAELYRDSILLEDSANIHGNIRLDEVSEVKSIIITESINGIPLSTLNEMLRTQNPQYRAEIVHETIRDIEVIVDETVEMIKRLPEQYLYLEQYQLHTPIPSSISAKVGGVMGDVILHVQSEEPGHSCGLSETCNCPNQYVMHVGPQYAFNIIENKPGQRVFSYNNGLVNVFVMTTTKSSSFHCRANDSAAYEYTTIMWTTTPVGNKIGDSFTYPEKIMGYISDVEFFSLDGHVYVILSRFYEPVLNTNDLDCLVLRLSKEGDHIEDMQKIRARGAWTLHVFHTAQGINLIIGNKGNDEFNYAELTTDIYRFNADTKRFTLLRTVPSRGCLSATSVVFDYDSLIILVHSNSRMDVLQHNRQFDNYYVHKVYENSSFRTVSTFYTGGVGISDAYLTAVTDNDRFYIFAYRHLAGWQLVTQEEIEGIRGLIPFSLNKEQYLFAPSTKNSTILSVVKHGYY